MTDSDLQAICDRWDITFHPDGREAVTNPDPQVFVERSFSAGDEIFMGQYADPERRLLAFFHELGHCVTWMQNEIPVFEACPYYHYPEALAWKRGIELAAEHGVTFTPESLAWARKELTSYFGDGSPEKTPLRFLEAAFRDAGLE